jgi:hypothetical protein
MAEGKKQSQRLKGGKGTAVARQRYDLYKLANEQLKAAYDAGFYIECVSICESIIADRIEARLQFLRRDTEKPPYVASLGSLLKQVEDTRAEDKRDLIEAYDAIREWSKARNATIHQFVKVTDRNQQSNGDDRIRQARAAARNGIRLMRKVSALIRKYNKWM